MIPTYQTRVIFKMFFRTWDRQEIVGFLVRGTVCLEAFGNADVEEPSRECLTGLDTRSQVRPPLEPHRRVAV